jgi:chemotaxis protein CheX
MNVEVINPFIHSTVNFFETMVNISPRRGKPFISKDPSRAMTDVSGVIGITGDVDGWVAIRLSRDTALEITARMTGEEKKYIDSMVRDAIAEAVNIVAGSAKSEFSSKGQRFTIAIPTVVVGDDHSLSQARGTIYMIIPFESDIGSFSVDVCLTESRNL